MKIHAYLLDGIPITEYDHYEASTIPSGTELLKVAIYDEPLEDGYADVTSIPLWEKLFDEQLINRDYKFIRHGMAQTLATSGWVNLPLSEQEIAARWFIVDASTRAEVYTIDEQVSHGIHFHHCSVAARKARFEAASTEIYNRFTRLQQTAIVGAVESAALPKLYIEYGIEGTDEGDMTGLFDYLEAREHTAYSGIGLATQDYVPSGMNMSQLVEKVMEIFTSGVYDYWQFL